MSIKKYLENINTPEVHPGPFSVRLKYELEKEYFHRKRSFGWYPAFATAALVVMVFAFAVFIFKPDLADKAHYAFWRAEGKQYQLFAENSGIAQSAPNSIVDQSNFVPVNNLSNLDESKSYVIKKVRDRNNRSIFYVSEYKGQQPKVKLQY